MFDREYVKITGYITTFDIDVDFEKIFPKRCKSCYSLIDQPNGQCLQRKCDHLRGLTNNQYTKNFETNLIISDHTSELSNIKTYDRPFQTILGHKVLKYVFYFTFF